MKPIFCLVVALLPFEVWLRAEDWKTTDGRDYQDVKVVASEPDAVTILYRDGGALVPLSRLPADLQKRFNYDPIRAQAAAGERAKADAESAKALQVEMLEATDLEKKVLAKQKAEQQAAAEEMRNLMNAASGHDFVNELMNPKDFVDANLWGHLTSDPTKHYQMRDFFQSDPLAQGWPLLRPPVRSEIDWGTVAQDQTVPNSDPLSSALDARKIRLIGKVESIVPAGYILGSVSPDDHYIVPHDPSRPDYELLSEQTNRGTVFLYTSDRSHQQKEIMDVDVYPMSTYTGISGETMRAFTTSASLARDYLKLKQHH